MTLLLVVTGRRDDLLVALSKQVFPDTLCHVNECQYDEQSHNSVGGASDPRAKP